MTPGMQQHLKKQINFSIKHLNMKTLLLLLLLVPLIGNGQKDTFSFSAMSLTQTVILDTLSWQPKYDTLSVVMLCSDTIKRKNNTTNIFRMEDGGTLEIKGNKNRTAICFWQFGYEVYYNGRFLYYLNSKKKIMIDRIVVWITKPRYVQADHHYFLMDEPKKAF